MKTVTIEIPDFTYAEAQRIADRMNETLPDSCANYWPLKVSAASVISAAVNELSRVWPERELDRVVPRDYANG